MKDVAHAGVRQVPPGAMKLVACPCDEHGELVVTAGGLKCEICSRVYPVVNGVPVLLLDAAISATDGGSETRRK